MKRFWALLAAFSVFLSIAWAGEQVDLLSPDQASPGTLAYYVAEISMDRDAATVEIRLCSPIGLTRTFTFSGADALSYIRAMNRRDASTISNEKWTLQQLITKGYLSGSISGTPE
jgi:hypothetical protein